MKTLNEYLTENKKVYSFKIKVAGDVPKDFEADVKQSLQRVNVLTFEKVKTTPVQKTPPDFPELSNAEVTIYNVILEYPITAPEIIKDIKDTGLDEEYFRVRGAGEPSEVDELMTQNHEGEAILDDPDYKSDNTEIKQEELAGPEFNKSFLQDLATAAAERRKTLGDQEKNDPDVLGSHKAEKIDKAGVKSAIGSK